MSRASPRTTTAASATPRAGVRATSPRAVRTSYVTYAATSGTTDAFPEPPAGSASAARRLGHRLRLPVLLVTPRVAAGGEDERVATDREAIPNASHTALATPPDNVEALLLPEDGAPVLHAVHDEDRPSRFPIDEALLDATTIAAKATTDVEVAAPDVATFEGHLLPAEGGDEVLGALRVVVQGAGGTAP